MLGRGGRAGAGAVGGGDGLGLAFGGGGQNVMLLIEALLRRPGIAGQGFGAALVTKQLGQSFFGAGLAFLGLGLLAVEGVTVDLEALQRRGSLGLCLAQTRQFGGGFGLLGGLDRGRLGRLGYGLLGLAEGAFGLRQCGLGLVALEVQDNGLGAADLVVDVAVSGCLAGLLLEALKL